MNDVSDEKGSSRDWTLLVFRFPFQNSILYMLRFWPTYLLQYSPVPDFRYPLLLWFWPAVFLTWLLICCNICHGCAHNIFLDRPVVDSIVHGHGSSGEIFLHTLFVSAISCFNVTSSYKLQSPKIKGQDSLGYSKNQMRDLLVSVFRPVFLRNGTNFFFLHRIAGSTAVKKKIPCTVSVWHSRPRVIE